ncbi:hypothetical protein ACH5RR_007118 [Cinchona calisaya]|uniref:Retrotransposon Copia-like N-terminal domain-containing protein n=1 Tax=Cinchona calisaya TaxID=153742 RepID=A0ABD3AQV8_9GENT
MSFVSIPSQTSQQLKLSIPSHVPEISNIKIFIPLELTYTNFLTWKRLFTTFLKSQNMLAIVDGSLPCPEPSDESYDLWVQCDITVHSWINASLSLTILEILLNHGSETTSHAWNTLERLFLDHAASNMMHLKQKF